MFRQCPSPNRFDMDGSSEMCVINFFFILMRDMFYGAYSFNQPIENWNTKNVHDK